MARGARRIARPALARAARRRRCRANRRPPRNRRRAAGPAQQWREPDPQDRTDICLRYGAQHPLIPNADRLQAHRKGEPLLDVEQRHLHLTAEQLGETRPEDLLAAHRVVVEPRTGTLAAAPERYELLNHAHRRRGRVDAACCRGQPLRFLLNRLHQLQRNLIEHRERLPREPGQRCCPFDHDRINTLADHAGRLQHQGSENTAGEEPAPIVHNNRCLFQLHGEVERARERLIAGRLAHDDLNQRHPIDRAEEVNADDIGGSLHTLGQQVDRQR